MRQRATVEPVLDGSAALLINAVRGVDIDSRVIPAFTKAVVPRQAIFDSRADDGVFVRTRIEINLSAEDLPDGLDVFSRRAPVLAEGVDFPAGAHMAILKNV